MAGSGPRQLDLAGCIVGAVSSADRALRGAREMGKRETRADSSRFFCLPLAQLDQRRPSWWPISACRN